MNELNNTLLTNRSAIDKNTLVQIAISDNNESLINDLLSKDVPTQLRAFMLASAKSDLIRVLQLTDALEKLEDVYVARALDDAEGMDMMSLARTIQVITASLQRSMTTIEKVTNDDKLQIIIDQSNKVINNISGPGGASNVSLITDKTSREKLRNITSKLLSVLDPNPSRQVNSLPSSDNTIDVG